MLMQALFSRGGEPINHNINGFAYVFEENEHGDFVTDVLSGEHRDMMERSGNFKVYEEPGPEAESESQMEPQPEQEPEAEIEVEPESEKEPGPENEPGPGPKKKSSTRKKGKA